MIFRGGIGHLVGRDNVNGTGCWSVLCIVVGESLVLERQLRLPLPATGACRSGGEALGDNRTAAATEARVAILCMVSRIVS